MPSSAYVVRVVRAAGELLKAVEEADADLPEEVVEAAGELRAVVDNFQDEL